MQIKETHRAPNEQNQKKISSWHIVIKTLSMKDKESILKAEREKT